ncbi:MAG: protein kinase [Deltaproteobacteria bacterium]|nr:protein kinase [Deltaproteobacteria bacterium]
MKAGDIVLDRYEVVRPGKGGSSGMVYEARDRDTGRYVAVKLITDRGEESYAIRVEREIKILASLSHPHVVEYIDSGTAEDGSICVVLEWLEGEDLAAALERGALSLERVLEIGVQASLGLAAAHDLGVVHRDIKPANVFLVGGGLAAPDIRVLDFGVAKSLEEQANVTRAGAILGTAYYMAPEQAQRAKHADARADVFGLGVVLYEALTRQLPWKSRTPYARLARISIDPAIPLRAMSPRVPAAVAQLVERMLALDPAARPASMREVTEELSGILESLTSEELAGVYAAPKTAVAALIEPPSYTGDIPADDSAAPFVRVGPPSPMEGTSKRRASVPTEVLEAPDPAELQPVGFPVITSEVARRPHDVPSLTAERRPLVGHARVVERIRTLIASALSNEKPALVVVSGPAGIGKTRLRVELTEILKSSRGASAVLAGRAEEPMRSVPGAFLSRVIQREARIYSDDLPEVRRKKLEGLMPSPEEVAARLQKGEGASTLSTRSQLSEQHTRHVQIEGWTARPSVVAALSDAFDWEEADANPDAASDFDLVASFFAEALGVPAIEHRALAAARRDPVLMAAETRRALDIVLTGLAKDEGLAVLIDDAHLLDASSAFVLRELVRTGRSRPIVLVLFTMPGMLEPIWSGVATTHVEVPPLDPGSARELAEATAGGKLEVSTMEAIVARSGGNPLFLVQLVMHGIETKSLVQLATGRLGFAQGSSADSLPHTVAAAARERLRLLSNEDQKLLVAAATFGDVFWLEGVAHLLGEPVSAVAEGLERLGRQDLVRQRPSSRYRGQRELEVAHAVLRSIILSKVKKSRREILELSTLEYFARVRETEDALLAEHAAEAGRDEDAARLWIAAARRSIAVGALEHASDQVERGLRSEENLPDPLRADLHELGAEASRLEDEPPSAAAHLDALLGLDLTSGRRGRAEISAAELALARGHLDEARAHVEAAFAHSEVASDAALVAAELLEESADERAALRTLLRAKSMLEEAAGRDSSARAALCLARIALSSADYRSAEARYREALVVARSSHDASATRRALVGLAEVARRVGQIARAHDYLAGAERLARTLADDLSLRVQRGQLSAEDGDLDRARWIFDDVDRAAARYPAVRRFAALSWAQSAVGFGAEELPPSNVLWSSISILERSLDEARSSAPRFVTSLSACLGLFLAAVGAVDRGLDASRVAISRFAETGSLAEDEAPRLLLSHARTLSLARAPLADVRGALFGAVEQLDQISGRLERTHRADFLRRTLARTILRSAKSAGIDVRRDEASHRLRFTKD